MEKGKSIYLTKEQIEQIQVVISYHVEGLPYSDFYKEENELCEKILQKLWRTDEKQI